MHCESQKTSLSIIENKFKFQTKLNLLSNIARKPIIVFFSFLYTRPPPPTPHKKAKLCDLCVWGILALEHIIYKTWCKNIDIHESNL